MSRKLNIYFLLSTVKVPTPTGGDKINEILLMKSMASFANVYYNEQLIKPNEKNLGITSANIRVPRRKYDLYYVRNNKEIFMKLPHPKIWLGSPYDDECFRAADAIATFTESWRHKLLNFEARPAPGLYKGKIHIPQRVITLHQCYDPQFRPGLRETKACQAIRQSFGGDFIIGHFGRVSQSCYPYSLLKIIPQLKATFPNKKIRTIFCGMKSQWHADINSPHIKIKPPFSRSQMPYALAACDVVLCNYRTATAHWGGCRRIIEAMACGVPVLCGDFDVRREQLGSDYPLFWTYTTNKGRISAEAEDQMLNHLIRLINEPEWGKQIGERMIERSAFYSLKENGMRVERDLNRFLSEYQQERIKLGKINPRSLSNKKTEKSKPKKPAKKVDKKPTTKSIKSTTKSIATTNRSTTKPASKSIKTATKSVKPATKSTTKKKSEIKAKQDKRMAKLIAKKQETLAARTKKKASVMAKTKKSPTVKINTKSQKRVITLKLVK